MNQFTSHQLDNMTTLISLLNKITNERFDHSNFSMIGEPLCALGHGIANGELFTPVLNRNNHERVFGDIFDEVFSGDAFGCRARRVTRSMVICKLADIVKANSITSIEA